MMKSVLRFPHIGKGLAAAALLTLAVSAGAYAQSAAVDRGTHPLIAVSTAGHGPASFDWLAKRGSSTDATLFQARYKPVLRSVSPLGRGSYVCSPAGFGRKSRCYQR